jgi:hypothetical protein
MPDELRNGAAKLPATERALVVGGHHQHELVVPDHPSA